MEGHESQGAGPKFSSEEEYNLLSFPFSTFLRDTIPVLELTLDSWTRLDRKIRLIVKEDGKLVACCDVGRELLRSGEVIRIERGKVVIADCKCQSQFEAILSGPDDSVATLLVSRRGIEGHWILRAIKSGREMVCVTLQEATDNAPTALPDLRSTFGLTHSEACIVGDLYDGLSPHEIAEKRGNSIHTVRAHLRRSYDKLHITSREQLWHRLRSYQL